MTTALRLDLEPDVGRTLLASPVLSFPEIAERAETLDDRLARFDVGDAATSGTGNADIERWTHCVTRGDASAFTRRLAWDGLSPANASAALARPTGDTPDWMPTLRDAFDAMAHPALGTHAPARVADHGAAPTRAPVAFERLLLPFLAVGRDRLRVLAGARYVMLADSAHHALERALLERLAHVCTRALYAAFSSFKSERRFTDAAYDDFVQHMYGGGMVAFFSEYCVAARLCASATDLWVAATHEFIERLDADLDAIATTFGSGAHPGPVTGLRASLSDPHCGGRGVLIAEWACGLSVVYKPRPLEVDALFGRLLIWASARLEGIELRPLRVLARGEYGWIELARHEPCADAAGVERYYTRCGALLCVVYALNGGDFHHENFLAAGEHPVLLDLEMLLGHRFLLAEHLPAAGMPHADAKRRHIESVLNLRMLPAPKPVTFGVTCESGAFSAEGRAQHRAVWDGQPISASCHVPALVRGFSAMFHTLRRGASELLMPGGVLDALRGESVRFILRNTSLYLALIERATRPEHLRSGITFGIQFDVLTKTFLAMDERPPIWPVVEAERCALELMDVPLFTARIDSRDLELPTGEVVQNCFEESAFEMMARRLAGLDDNDLADQVDLITGAFEAAARRDLHVAPRSVREPDHSPQDTAEITRDEAVAAARAIARDLCARAARPGAGALSWIGAGYLPAARGYELRPMTYDLFDGYGGIALFLAALHQVSGDEQYRAMALATLAPVRSRLEEIERIMRMRRASEVGLGFGPASIAVTLARIGTLVNEPALLGDAARLAALVTPELVASEDSYDILAGSAGAVLSLMALSTQLNEPALLARADAFGEHLLKRRALDAGTRCRTWRAPSGAAESGFAHGQAGIAYALKRLACATGRDAYSDAAHEAIAFERSRASTDASAARRDEHTAAWARGATGMALARLGAWTADHESQTMDEIDEALDSARASFGVSVDTLCCGDGGRLELLREAAVRLNRPELLATARGEARALVARAAARGGYDTGWSAARRWDGGLFHGTAGIGYTLLRLVEPTLPSLCLIA